MVEGKGINQIMDEPWHYDNVLSQRRQDIKRTQEEIRSLQKYVKKEDENLRRAKKRGGKLADESGRIWSIDEASQNLRTWRIHIHDLIDSLPVKHHLLNMVNQSRPILVGPATLDSLINRDPGSYDYIVNQQLPFDNLFFDFVEPPIVGLPASSEKAELIGVDFHKGAFSDKVKERLIGGRLSQIDALLYSATPYGLSMWFKSDKDLFDLNLDFQTVHYAFDFSRPAFFVRGHSNSKGLKLRRFIINPFGTDSVTNSLNTIVKYSTSDDVQSLSWEDRKRFLNAPLDAGLEFHHESPIEEVPNGELLRTIPKFCVNLINYINAHNVQVTQRTRGKYVPYQGEDIFKLPTEKRPFYLITIRDEIIEESQEKAARSWNLQWRIYVRGHNVKYRNSDGSIKLVTWRKPHIRGPPNAPWREQRYELLASKLEREIEMYRQQSIDRANPNP